jgi:hypothetical protein
LGFKYIYEQLFKTVNICRRDDLFYSPFVVIERFEEAEGRKPGEICIEDLPAVLKLKKELCEAQVRL